MVLRQDQWPPRIECPECNGSGRDKYSGSCPLCNGQLTVQPFTMSQPCKFPACAGNRAGFIRKAGPSNSARCAKCFQFQYCPSKLETGEERRSIRSRPDLKPGQRDRILAQDGNRCFLCGRGPAESAILHVAHALSVDEGRKQGLSDDELMDDGNLFAACEECNLVASTVSLDPKWPYRLLVARLRRGKQ